MRGRGLKFDNPHKCKAYKPLPGIGASADTGFVSLAKHEAQILDQGQTGSCEGHRTAMGIWVAMDAANTPLTFFPSPDDIYRNARCWARETDAHGQLPPLQDEGANTNDVIAVTYTCGIRKMNGPTADGRNSDCDPATVNREPTLDELQQDGMLCVTGEWGTIVVGDYLTTIQTALKQGYPVWLDVYADEIFEVWGEGWTPSRPPINDCTFMNGGGHAILCTELQVNADGSAVLSGPNSWGADWGAPPLDPTANQQKGHWRATRNWLEKAVQNVVVGRVYKA